MHVDWQTHRDVAQLCQKVTAHAKARIGLSAKPNEGDQK